MGSLPVYHPVRRGLTLALLACLGTLLAAWPAHPASASSVVGSAATYVPLVINEGPDSPLAYGADGGIFVMNADGSGQTNLTTTPTITAFLPQWSPTAKKLAYTSLVGNKYDPTPPLVHLMNADGTAKTRLCEACAYPVWSPDGHQLAVSGDCERDLYGFVCPSLAVVNADGSVRTKLCEACSSPAWSPEGTKLVLVLSARPPDRGGGIYVLNLDGSGTTQLCEACGSPVWSPDGLSLAFLRFTGVRPELDIFVMNADGSEQTNLTNTPAVQESIPVWSPDGLKLAYTAPVSTTYSRDDDLFVMNADGSNPTNLTNTPYVAERTPQWSPKATKLAYSSQTQNPVGRDIYSMHADGSGMTNLTTTPQVFEDSPVWLSQAAWRTSSGP